MNTFGEFSPEEVTSEVDSIYKELETQGYSRPSYQAPVPPQVEATQTPELSASRTVDTPLQTPSQPDSQLMPASESMGAADYLLDAARGVVRGGLGAVESTADLLALGYLPNDFLTGNIDRPKTMVGGLAEGATEFAVGFIPAFGIVSKVAKIGKIARLGSVGKLIQKSSVLRGAVAGAVADFTVFDEHEERLSNLVQQFPSLQNPITEYLSADKDDGLLEGRLKNVLEGAVVGSVIDGVVIGVKALKKARGLAEAGKTAEAEKVLAEAGTQIDPLVKSAEDSANAMKTSWAQDEAMRQSPQGSTGLRNDLTMMDTPQPSETFGTIRGPEVKSAEESAAVIEAEMGRLEQIRQSPEGAVGLKNDLAQGTTQLGENSIERTLAPNYIFDDPAKFREAFSFKGDGHKNFSIRLDAMVQEKSITSDARDLIMGVIFKNGVNDTYLKNMEVGTGNIGKNLGYGGREVQATKLPSRPGVRARTVKDFSGPYNPYLMLKKELAPFIEKRFGVDAPTGETFSTFWHEYGHAGYFSLLDEAQRKSVTALFNKTDRASRRTFFEKGSAAGSEFYTKYYAKSESEWFAQSFAEYVIKEKTDIAELKPLFESIVEKLKQYFSELFGREERVELDQIFQYILKGENYGEKPVFGVVKKFRTDGLIGMDRSLTASFKKRITEAARTMESGKAGMPMEDSAAGGTVRATPQEAPVSIPPTAQARFDEYLKIYEKSPEDLNALAKAFFDETDRPIFNIESFDSVDSAHKSALALMKTFADTIERAKGEPRGADVVAQDAIDFIRKHTDGTFISQLTKDAKNSRQADARIRAYYGLAVSLQDKVGRHVDEFMKARDLLDQYPDDPALLKRYSENYLAASELQQKFGSVVFGYQTVRSNAGRSLNVFKQIKEQATLVEYAKAMIDQAGGKKDVEATLDKLHLIWKKHGGAGLAKDTPAGMLDMHNELWINFLLSGPKTFAVNGLGTALTTAMKPITSAIGAHGMYLKTGDTSFKMMRDQYINVYGYMMDSFKEAIDLGLKAFREGDSVLQRGTSPIEKGPAITGQNVNAILNAERDANPVLAGVADFFGTVVRTPSRILTGTDEFFKQINYRAYAKAKATIEGMEALGKGAEDPRALAEWVAARMDNIVMQDGRRYSKSAVRAQAVVEATNRFGKDGLDSLDAADFITKYISDNWDSTKGSLSDYAFDVSQEVTFTRRGERDPNTNKASLQLSLERLVSNHPALRLVVPFVTTPMNILKMVGQYTYGAAVVGSPLKNIPFLMAEKTRLARELADPDPMVRAAAQGKVYMGVALTSTAIGAAAAGMITGGGPADENEKKIKMATGWRPYSFKVGGTYVSYQRLDPFATFLGLAADIMDRSTALKAQDENPLHTAVAAMAVAFSKNITNKSYLAGIEQITDAFSDPERFVPRLIQNRLGSYVPGAISQAVGAFGDDPYMREARGWYDSVTKKIPGASNFVDPTRNLLGEKVERTGIAPGIDYINPIVVSSNKKDAVMDELSALQHGFTQPRPIQDGGIDYTDYKNANGQTAYDRWLEATSEVRVNGKTVRQALDRLIKNRSYQGLSSELLEDFDSPRAREVRKVISAYRSVAKEKILREFPELNQQTTTATRVKLALRRGENVEELLSQLRQ